jgi:hypothetical protein
MHTVAAGVSQAASRVPVEWAVAMFSLHAILHRILEKRINPWTICKA